MDKSDSRLKKASIFLSKVALFLFVLFINFKLERLFLNSIVDSYIESITLFIMLVVISIIIFIIIFFQRNLFKNMDIIFELIILSIVGCLAQQLSFAHKSSSFFNDYLGFTLLLPLFGSIMHIIYHKFYIQNRVLFTTISSVLALLVLVTNYMIYPLFGGSTDKMYGTIILYGAFPMMIIGLIYAFYFIKVFGNMKRDKL